MAIGPRKRRLGALPKSKSEMYIMHLPSPPLLSQQLVMELLKEAPEIDGGAKGQVYTQQKGVNFPVQLR